MQILNTETFLSYLEGLRYLLYKIQLWFRSIHISTALSGGGRLCDFETFQLLKSSLDHRIKLICNCILLFPIATLGLHLGFPAVLKIWQIPACKVEPRSGYIMQLELLCGVPTPIVPPPSTKYVRCPPLLILDPSWLIIVAQLVSPSVALPAELVFMFNCYLHLLFTFLL